MTAQRTAFAVAAALTCAAASLTPAHGAFTLAGIDFWVGPAAGPGVNQAVLVIDFAFPGAAAGAPSLAWGYRWPASEPRTGRDLVTAIVAADPRLQAAGLESGFIDTIGYDADLDGTLDHAHPGYDPETGRYSNYWVNNAVTEGTAPAFADAGHVLPPNGNPFAASEPGTWVFSTTGIAGRPLADGSWDGWIFASEPVGGPRVPAAAPVPEPAAAILVLAGTLLWRRRRPQIPSAAAGPAAHPPQPTLLPGTTPSR